jgi:SAM-dependent methyltransferase
MDRPDIFPGQWQPQLILAAALKVGLIEALLERPRSPQAVARELGLDERATLRVLRALLDAGYLEEGEDELVVAPELRPLLDSHDAAFVGYRLAHVCDLLGRWLQLPGVLREGGPARIERTPESLQSFIGAMRTGARERAEPLAERLAELLPATKTVLDLGGGPGTQALAFQKHGWQVTVLDLPDVIDLMTGELASAGITTIKGDATKGIPTCEVNLIFCGNLFHSMAPAECATVIANAAAVLSSGGALAIYDFLRGSGLGASLFAVNMLVATSAGDVYGENDYRGWCEAAGLRSFALHEVPGPSQRLMIARKP